MHSGVFKSKLQYLNLPTIVSLSHKNEKHNFEIETTQYVEKNDEISKTKPGIHLK